MLNESASELKVENIRRSRSKRNYYRGKTSERIQINVERDFNSLCYIWSIWIVILINLFVYHQVDEYIPKWIENSVKSYVMEHDIYGWILMIAILLVLSWIISTIGYALKHGDFTVNRRNDEVRISQGLLEKKNSY